MLPELQDWIRYIAMDEDGTWTAFADKPELVEGARLWVGPPYTRHEETEQEIFKPASDWRHSLIKVR